MSSSGSELKPPEKFSYVFRAPLQHTFVKQYDGFSIKKKLGTSKNRIRTRPIFRCFCRQNVRIWVWNRNRNRKNLPGQQHFYMDKSTFFCPELFVQISGYILGLWNALHQVQYYLIHNNLTWNSPDVRKLVSNTCLSCIPNCMRAIRNTELPNT